MKSPMSAVGLLLLAVIMLAAPPVPAAHRPG
jgi:hypothetical protein